MSAICIIPARGGSVRIPRKNIKPFFGKPIILYSIETALASELFDQVIVSTDDDEIKAIAQKAAAWVHFRPPGWDELGTQEVASRIVEAFSPVPELVCVIYATVPMLSVEDLKVGLARNNATTFALSVGTDPLRDAGMFYWGTGEAFCERVRLFNYDTRMVPIPEERICDINEPYDWSLAEKMYAKWKGIECPAS
jgi:N-acylneuraminate cytidylyltransferase